MIAAFPTFDEDLLERICAEYREMPALRLTVAQAQRLWSLDRETCAEALAALVRSHCLWRTRDGVYAKAGVGEDVCAWHRTTARV
ncbi:MAG TPA: hypothetical protein VFX12_01960 [Vicinamibacterales bacterium]|nr:hypothetical protein [Vicinamibacterales bacterium]